MTSVKSFGILVGGQGGGVGCKARGIADIAPSSPESERQNLPHEAPRHGDQLSLKPTPIWDDPGMQWDEPGGGRKIAEFAKIGSPSFPQAAERMGKENLNYGTNTVVHAVAQRRVAKTSASAKCMWPDGTTASAHQAGLWFCVQGMKGHDTGCQCYPKEGQRQEFLHIFLLSKMNHAIGARYFFFDKVMLTLGQIFSARLRPRSGSGNGSRCKRKIFSSNLRQAGRTRDRECGDPCLKLLQCKENRPRKS